MSSTSPDVFADLGLIVGEGPAWDARKRCLIAVDIIGRRVLTLGEDGTLSRDAAVTADVGAALPTQDVSELLVFLRDTIATLADDGSIQPITSVSIPDDVRFNDAKCDPAGRAWAGTMGYQEQPGAGALYRIDQPPTTVLTRLTISNGMGWSPAGTTMYFIDSPTKQIQARIFDPETGTLGAIRNRIAVQTEVGIPDGMCVDSDGCIWVAIFGGGCVQRYSPAGRLLEQIDLPVSQVTSCAFGAASTLHITTATYGLNDAERRAQPHAGAIFAVRTSTSGPAAVPWRHPKTEIEATQ